MTSTCTNIIIIGTNDNATACALRLFRAGFHVCMLSEKVSLDLHHFRNFSSVLSNGSREINGVKAQSYADFIYHREGSEKGSVQKYINFLKNDRKISVISEKDLSLIKMQQFHYCVICDPSLYHNRKYNGMDFVTISYKQEIEADYNIIGSGGFTGQVDYKFLTIPQIKGIPEIHTISSTKEGVFVAEKNPGEKCIIGERVATIDDLEIFASHEGVVEGVIPSGVIVAIDKPVLSISNKNEYDPKILPYNSFSVAGGVLEAIMFHNSLNSI